MELIQACCLLYPLFLLLFIRRQHDVARLLPEAPFGDGIVGFLRSLPGRLADLDGGEKRVNPFQLDARKEAFSLWERNSHN